jgi:ABC-type lipoprotein export system ATPase subunit
MEWDMDSLRLEAVSKAYTLGNKEKLPVLKDLCLRVEAGDMVAVMGPSGSGKTTLLNIIAGIDRPDDGSVCIEGRCLSEMDQAETALFRRRRMGMVFQDFNLIECLSVRENILLPMILDNKPADEQDLKAARLMRTLGIEDIAEKNVADISGGQKQRAAIARALVNDPALLLADEPTGNLDAKSTRDVMRDFARVNRETGTSILMVTHDAAAASQCKRAVLLKGGRVAAEVRREGDGKAFLDEIAAMLVLLGGEQDDV